MNNQSDFKHRLHQVITDLEHLIIQKNKAYGNSYEVVPEMFRILYPNGISPAQYEDVLILVRIFDKIKRVAEANDPFGESPFTDIAGYALVQLATFKRKEAEVVNSKELLDKLDVDRGITRPNGGLSSQA